VTFAYLILLRLHLRQCQLIQLFGFHPGKRAVVEAEVVDGAVEIVTGTVGRRSDSAARGIKRRASSSAIIVIPVGGTNAIDVYIRVARRNVEGIQKNDTKYSHSMKPGKYL